MFWFGIVEPDEHQIEDFYRRLARDGAALCPPAYEAAVPLARGDRDVGVKT